MYLIKHKVFGDYKAISKTDVWRMKAFNNFEVIKDEKQIGEILRTEFNSATRGGDYNPNLPSVTQIVGSLYPIDFSHQYGLMLWLNNKTITNDKEAKKSSKTACGKGTDLHKVLEDTLIDNNGITLEGFSKYTSDEEIIATLDNFKNDHAGKIIPVKTEFFLQTSYTQGTVDLLAEYDGELTLIDWKTTSKYDKSRKKYRFSYYNEPQKSYKDELGQYMRQLALYTIMLEDTGILTPKEIDNMNYKIFQFHFMLKDYKMFEFSREEIKKLEPDIIKVLAWYQELIRHI